MPKKKQLTFWEWADDKNLVTLAAGFTVSLAINRFMQEFIDTVVKSFLVAFADFRDLEYKLTDKITLKIGQLLTEFINLAVIVYLSFLMIKYSQKVLGWT